MTTKIRNGITIAAVLGAGLLTLGGCQGHGKYTSEGMDQANERVAAMKAMTSYDMARQQFLSGDLTKAMRTIDESIGYNDEVPASHILRGRIQIEMAQLEGAMDSFDRAIAIDLAPEDMEKLTEAYYYKGIIFERFDQPESALQAFQQAMRLEPNNAQYILAAAEMYIEMDQLFNAQRLLERSKREFEHNAGIRQTLGHIAMMRGDHEQAADLFEQAAILGSGDATLREDQLRALIALGEYEEAENTLSWLLRDDAYQNRFDLHHLHAKVLLELQRPVAARKILMDLTSSRQGRDDFDAWTDLGNAAMMLDDMPRLRAAGQRLTSIAPRRADGYMFTALFHRRKGNFKKAVQTLFNGMRTVQDDPRMAVLQGMIYQDMGQNELARRSFNIALERDPGNQDAENMLASLRYQSPIKDQWDAAHGNRHGRHVTGSELVDAVEDDPRK